MCSSMLWRRLPSPSVTPNELLEILTAHTAGYYVLPAEPSNEVFPGIYLGDSTTALCLHLLRKIGITHVLNAAWGKQRNFGMVNTSANYYRNSGIEFLGIEALDIAVFPLFEHFYAATQFIDCALNEGGKILVHCGEGISRSSTLVLAYLMIKRGFTVQDAVRQVVKHRNILPNQGFLLQLCQLHDQLQTSSLPPPPSLSPTVRSSVSPMPERISYSSIRPSNQYNSKYSHESNTLHREQHYPQASSLVQKRCPSPSPVRAWSNGWLPPARSSSPSRRSYLSNLSPSSSYSSRYTPNSSYLNNATSLRSRRCQSVDREYPSSSLYGTGSYDSNRMYSNSLLSSYIGRPRHLSTIR